MHAVWKAEIIKGSPAKSGRPKPWVARLTGLDSHYGFARENDLPLWDTKSTPHRYAVGHLTIEEEEDPANQDWVELV